MGDRGNILLIDSTDKNSIHGDGVIDGIYLYSHWSGSMLPAYLRSALYGGKNVWGDSPYLNRWIVDQILSMSDCRDGETGAGLSLSLTDNEHTIIICDTGEDKVHFADEGSEKNMHAWKGTMTFEEFMSATSYPDDFEQPKETRARRKSSPTQPF